MSHTNDNSWRDLDPRDADALKTLSDTLFAYFSNPENKYTTEACGLTKDELQAAIEISVAQVRAGVRVGRLMRLATGSGLGDVCGAAILDYSGEMAEQLLDLSTTGRISESTRASIPGNSVFFDWFCMLDPDDQKRDLVTGFPKEFVMEAEEKGLWLLDGFLEPELIWDSHANGTSMVHLATSIRDDNVLWDLVGLPPPGVSITGTSCDIPECVSKPDLEA